MQQFWVIFDKFRPAGRRFLLSLRAQESPPAPMPPILWWQQFFAVAVLSLAIAVTYLNSFNADWTSEARETIRDAPRFSAAHLSNLWPLVQPGPGDISRDWDRALPRFSFWADRVGWGVDNAEAFHTTNILLHWVNALLLYAIALAVMRNIWAAVFVAAIFGVHPVGTDAVSNIAGRPELLGAVAVLGGLYCCIRSVSARGWHQIRWLLLLCFCQAAGLASHESALALPVILAAYHYSFGTGDARWNGFRRSLLALTLPLLAAGLIFLRHLFKPPLPLLEGALAANPLLALDAFHARLTALKVVAKSLWLTIWPASLLPDYSFNQIPVIGPGTYGSEWWKVMLTLIVIGVLAVYVRRAYHQSRPLFFFMLLFLIALVPMSNLLWLGPAIMLERNLYLSLAGFAGALMCLVYALSRWIMPWVARYHWAHREWPTFTARMTLLALVLCFGARTFARNLDWRNDQTLWKAAVEDAPNNYRTHFELASTILRKNDRRDFPLAMRENENALRITQQLTWPEPHLPRALLIRLGIAYREQGDGTAAPGPSVSPPSTESTQWYEKSAETLELAAAADQAEWERWRAWNRAVRLPAIYLNLGLVKARLGEPTAAVAAFQRFEECAPVDPNVSLDLARFYLALGETERGAIACGQAIALKKGWRDPFLVLAQLYTGKSVEHCDVAVPGFESVRIDVACSVLQDRLKVAYLRVIKSLLLFGDRETALRFKHAALQEEKFPRDQFDELLPESL